MDRTYRSAIYPKVDKNKGGDIMENAAKALLIAGAVLVVIVLITIGVYIISSQKGTIETSKEAADTLQVATFNSTFLKYIGSNKKGSEIKSLLTEVQTNNKRNPSHTIEVIYGDKTSISEIQTSIMPGKSYKVSADDTNGYDENGYIKSIVINDLAT